jgi:hypothetical protein
MTRDKKNGARWTLANTLLDSRYFQARRRSRVTAPASFGQRNATQNWISVSFCRINKIETTERNRQDISSSLDSLAGNSHFCNSEKEMETKFCFRWYGLGGAVTRERRFAWRYLESNNARVVVHSAPFFLSRVMRMTNRP